MFKDDDFTHTATVVGLVAFAKTLGVSLEMSEDGNAFAVEWIANGGKRGAGAEVLRHAMARADEVGKPIILDAHEGNAKIIDYYAKLGFKPWQGELREFGGEWAHGMRREPEGAAVLAFDRWFADSKVVDATGKPRVVYHGTSRSFDAFDAKHAGNSSEHATADLGFFFSTDPRVAAIFVRESTGWDEDDLKTTPETPYFEGANTMPVYLRIQNPYRMEAAEFIAMADNATGKQVRAKLGRLKLQQHDGIFIPKAAPYLNAELVGDTFIAFEPEQIKSALSNGGAYDPKNPDITDGAPQRLLSAMSARSLAIVMTPKTKGKLRVV